MKSKKGFTLTELLVSITILSILSTVSVVGYYGYVNRNNLKLDELEVEQANTALEAYFVNNPDQLTTAKDVRDAIYDTTHGNFDLDTFSLRSAGSDYHLYYDTEERMLKVIRGIPEAKDDSIEKQANRALGFSMPDFNEYATIDSFLWRESTPYLFVTQTGEFGSFLHALNSGEYNRSNASTWDILGNKSEQKYMDLLKRHSLVLRDTSDDKDRSGSFYYFKDEETTFSAEETLFASSVEILKKDTIEAIPFQMQNFTFPEHVKLIADDALDGFLENNYYTKNDEFEFGFNAFGTPSTLYIDTVFPDGLQNHISPLKIHEGTKENNTLTIHYDEKVYSLYGDVLTDLSAPDQDETIEYPSENLERIQRFCDDVKWASEACQEHSYDLFAAVEKEGVKAPLSTFIKEIDARYQELELWEKGYILKNSKDLYDAFYFDSEGNLTFQTGLFIRLEIYRKKMAEIQAVLSAIPVGDYSNLAVLDVVSYLQGKGVTLEDTTTVHSLSFATLYSMCQRGNIQIDPDHYLITIPDANQAGVVIFQNREDNSEIELPFSFHGYAAIHTSISDMIVGKEFDLYLYSNGVYDNLKGKRPSELFDLGVLDPYYQEEESQWWEVYNEKTGKNVMLYRLHFQTLAPMEWKDYQISCGDTVQCEPIHIRVKEATASVSLQDNGPVILKGNESNYTLPCNIVYDTSASGYSIDSQGQVTCHVKNTSDNPQLTLQGKNLYGNGCTLDVRKVNYRKATAEETPMILAENSQVERLKILLPTAKGMIRNGNFQDSSVGIKGHSLYLDQVQVQGGLAGVVTLPDSNHGVNIVNSVFQGNVASILPIQDSSNCPNKVVVSQTIIDTKISDRMESDVLSRGVAIFYYPSEDGKSYDALQNVEVLLDDTRVYGWAKESEVRKTYGILMRDLLLNFKEANFKVSLDNMIDDHYFILAGPYWYPEETLTALLNVLHHLGEQSFRTQSSIYLPSEGKRSYGGNHYYNLISLIPSYLHCGIPYNLSGADKQSMSFGNPNREYYPMTSSVKSTDTQNINEFFMHYFWTGTDYYWRISSQSQMYFMKNTVQDSTWNQGPCSYH